MRTTNHVSPLKFAYLSDAQKFKIKGGGEGIWTMNWRDDEEDTGQIPRKFKFGKVCARRRKK